MASLGNGIELSCRAAGQRGNPVLVFLHGFPEAAFVWDELLEHFSTGYRCVAPNLRGYERSSAPVDVEAIMMDLEAKSGHKSNWRTSIVDLMSLLGMDNSLAERKELAKELGYTGDMNDSATMNMWLHKQVMKQMAANGGKVPAHMLD